MSVNAVHIETDGFQCPACPDIIRKALKGLPGVLDVVAVKSLHLTSVLYDPDVVEETALRQRLERCGFTTGPNALPHS